MIAASSPEEFIPLGRSTYNQHPGKHLFSGNNYCRDNASTTHQRHCLTEVSVKRLSVYPPPHLTYPDICEMIVIS